MCVNAQWIFPSLVLQQGQALHIRSCPHTHHFFFWPDQALQSPLLDVGDIYVPPSLQHLSSGERQPSSSMPPPLSWRLTVPCTVGEIKWQSESCYCCMGWASPLKQRCVAQGRPCRSGTAAPRFSKSWLNSWTLGTLLSMSQSQSSHLWSVITSLLHCCEKQVISCTQITWHLCSYVVFISTFLSSFRTFRF